MRGIRTHYIRSAGHRLFLRQLSAPAISATADWVVLFEQCFGKASAEKSDDTQAIDTSIFLLDTQTIDTSTFSLDKAMQNKDNTKKPLRWDVSKDDLQLLEDAESLQLFEDLELPHVFEQIIEELSVDHAVMFCTNLPANHLNSGINTLVTVLVDRAHLYEQDDISHAFSELVKLSRDENCDLLEETRQKLLEWSLISEDGIICKDMLQIVYQENTESTQPKDTEKPSIQPNYMEANRILDNNCKIKNKAFEILGKVDFTDPSCRSQLLSVFHAAGKFALTAKGKENIAQLQKLQLKGIPEYGLKAMINAFTKGLTEVHPNFRDVRRAVEVFKWITRQLQLKSVSSYNMLIAHSANHGEVDVCVHLIQTMKSHGLEPCASTYEPLIKFFSTTLEISKAEDILQVMLLSGMRVTAKAYTYLIGAHAKSGNMERAFNLLESVPCADRTADLYSPIIHEYGMKGHISRAVSLLQKMKKENLKPSGESFASLIRACAIRKNYKGAEQVFNFYRKQGESSTEKHTAVLSSMLRIYAALGDSKGLEKVLSLTDEDLLVSHAVKCSILQGFAETGSSEEALKIYNEIRDGGSFPDSCAFCSLLWSVGKAGEIDQLLSLFEQFTKSMESKHRVYQEKNMSLACSHVVHALILHNHLEEALIFLQRVQLEDAGDAETLCLKVFTEDKGNDDDNKRVPLALKDKLRFLELMRQRLQIQPTRLAYESLLESCAKEKDTEYAATILGMMNSDNMPLNVFTCIILLRIIVGRGDVEKIRLSVSEMKESMQCNGLMDKDVRMLVKAILKHGNCSQFICDVYPK